MKLPIQTLNEYSYDIGLYAIIVENNLFFIEESYPELEWEEIRSCRAYIILNELRLEDGTK